MLAKNPIFIIGPGRTASKLFRDILNRNEKVNITNEINFKFRVKTDVFKLLKESTGDISKVSDYMVKHPPYFHFLTEYNDEEKGLFKEELDKLNTTDEKQVLDFLLSYNAKKENKEIWGSKFPVHYSYLKYLLNLYPECKVIFLSRDLRGLYLSDKIKKQDYKRHIGSQWPKIKFKPLNITLIYLYCVLEWCWSILIYRKYRKKYNLKLFKYENLIHNPSESVKRLSEFLDILITPEMIKDVSVIGSSFEGKTSKGFEKKAINRWKSELNFFEKVSLKMIMYLFQY